MPGGKQRERLSGESEAEEEKLEQKWFAIFKRCSKSMFRWEKDRL